MEPPLQTDAGDMQVRRPQYLIAPTVESHFARQCPLGSMGINLAQPKDAVQEGQMSAQGLERNR